MVKWVQSGIRPEGSSLVGIDQSGNELKSLMVGNAELGGVLAPTDFVAQVVAGSVQYSPIRAIATVQQTARTSIQFPKRTGNFAAAWTAETGTRTETVGRTYGLDEIPTHELYARVLVSNWALEDAAVNIEQMIQNDAIVQFGVSEGAAFVSGNGVGKPLGLLSDPTVVATAYANGSTSFTGGADGIAADGIIGLVHSLKPAYWTNGRFVLNQTTLRDLRTLKDAAGNYLYQIAPDGVHGVSTGLPATLYGYPYTIAVDMPDVASNSLPVLFGDFKQAYWVVDRIQVQVLRDPYSAAANGEIILHLRKRVGGQVVLPEAVGALKMAA